jgi:hypothetical protein
VKVCVGCGAKEEAGSGAWCRLSLQAHPEGAAVILDVHGWVCGPKCLGIGLAQVVDAALALHAGAAARGARRSSS